MTWIQFNDDITVGANEIIECVDTCVSLEMSDLEDCVSEKHIVCSAETQTPKQRCSLLKTFKAMMQVSIFTQGWKILLS